MTAKTSKLTPGFGEGGLQSTSSRICQATGCLWASQLQRIGVGTFLFRSTEQGSQLSDYEDLPSEYRIEELPNASYKVAIHIATGKTVGVFDSSIFPTTQAQVLNILASYGATLAALFVSGPAAALGVEVFKALLGEALSDVHRMLSEHTQGFNGDFAPFRPPLPTGADPFPLTDPGTAGNDTRWGTGGLIGALYADTLYGQGKRLANTC